MKKDKSDLTSREVIYYIAASLVVSLIVGVFVFAWVELGATHELIDWLRSFVGVEIGAEL